MKLASVGLDNLPNVYIDSIAMINTSTMADSGIKTEIEITIHDSVNKHWSSDPLLLKFMRIIVVQSTSAMFSAELTTGNLILDPKVMSMSENYTTDSVQYKVIDIKGNLNSEVHKDSANNDILVYRFKAGFNSHSRPYHLNYYVAAYIDIQSVMGSYNVASSPHSSKALVGPVSSESVLSAGNVVRNTNMFLLPTGEVWTGPVHRHPNQGYMAGSKHRSAAHSSLEQIEVRNTKIKELTKKNYKNKALVGMNNFKALFSNLYISRRKDGTNRGLFMMDMESFIVRKTKHGKSLMNLDKDLFDSYLRSVRLSKITIERIAVRKGSPKFNKKKEIVSSKDNEAGSLIGTLLMNKRGDSLQIPLKDIMINKKQMKNGDSVEDFLYEGTLKELYLFGNNIRSFEFADYSAARGGNGDVVYSVSIKMIDRSTAFVRNILKEMTSVYNRYQNYLESAASIRNYSFKMNRPKASFIKQQNEDFAIDAEFNRLKQAPWIRAPEIYVKYLAMIKNIPKEESTQLKEEIYGMVNPTDFKIQNARKFSRDFRILISKYIEFFDVKGVTLAKTSSKTSTKSSKQNKMIEHNKMFTDVYSLKEDRMYDFLGMRPKNPGILRVDKSSFESRFQNESSNYSAGSYSSAGGDAGEIDTFAARALADVSGNIYSYLTPMKLIGNKDSKDISFRNVRKKSEKQKIDKFMNKGAPPMALRVRTLPKGLTTPDPDQSENEQTKADIEDKFLDAKETLGTNSLFTQFSGSVLPPEVASAVLSLNEQNIAKSSILNRFNFQKIKSTTSFDLTSDRNKITPILNNDNKAKVTQTLKSIPTQVKSLYFKRTGSPTNKLLKDDVDVLESPETSNEAELNFMTIQKIEFLRGFKRDQGQRIQINKPMWTLITAENYQQAVDNTSLCRMVYYENESLDISIDERKKLPIIDQYFILSNENEDANERAQGEGESLPIASALSDIYLEENKYDIKYATSNIVRQANNSDGIIREPISTGVSTAPTTTTPTTVAAPSVPSSPMGGGGY